MEISYTSICQSLPLIAQFSCGYVTAVNLADGRRKTVDPQGNEVNDYAVEECEGYQQALKRTVPMLVPAKPRRGEQNLFLPLGPCLLVISKVYPDGVENQLRATFEEAIPLIARVAGGEAVLFDDQGIRFFSVGPDGRESSKGMGQFTYLGKRAMELSTPVIGPSLLEEGALAVRIPITHRFGIGINNVVSVKQKKALATSSQHRGARYTFADIVGTSGTIRECTKQAHQVAKTRSTVLLSGPTGTGKELFAQSIHNASERSKGPFVAINCGALPPSLVESQLFGYEAGSFTGARREGQQGLFEQADGGTLFLDEVSEMELELQSRLLRVLQEREVMRIGGKRVMPVDVRVIASTNKDLWQMTASGKFRQDLFYRLNVVELHIPSLRERVEDILLLTRHFIEQFRSNFGSFIRDITAEALECLMCYPWPGNVRELQNCIERIMNLVTHEMIQLEDIPVVIRRSCSNAQDFPLTDRGTPINALYPPSPTDRQASPGIFSPQPGPEYPPSSEGGSLRDPTDVVQRTIIIQALEKAGYNRTLAAGRLGISTTTLWRKMKRLRIPVRP